MEGGVISKKGAEPDGARSELQAPPTNELQSKE